MTAQLSTPQLNRLRRETLGLPLKVIAHELGISISRLSKWERGTKVPAPSWMRRWNAFFRPHHAAK